MSPDNKRGALFTGLMGVVGAAYGTLVSWLASSHVGRVLTIPSYSIPLSVVDGFFNGVLFGIFLPEVALSPLIGILVVQKISGAAYYTATLMGTIGFIAVEAVVTEGEFNIQTDFFLGAIFHVPIVLVFAVAARAIFISLKRHRSAKVF
jgi:hypothetical protein